MKKLHYTAATAAAAGIKQGGDFSCIYNAALSFTLFLFLGECSMACDLFFPSITHISKHGDLQGTRPAVSRSAISSFSHVLASSSSIISMGSRVGFSCSPSFMTHGHRFLMINLALGDGGVFALVELGATQ